jgi:SAM-dependent methyltransferase
VGEAAYDRIGIGYRQVRQPDPRIAARIEAALGDARRVLNVGAGTGSYEPADREVTAVEPSAVMIAQRPAGSAPLIQATAEELPFEDGSFDAAMAIITVQHWADVATGLAEMRRVARRVVVLTFDPEPMAELWLVRDYFPRDDRQGDRARPRRPASRPRKRRLGRAPRAPAHGAGAGRRPAPGRRGLSAALSRRRWG